MIRIESRFGIGLQLVVLDETRLHNTSNKL
jgi:hypothetical protein